MWTTWPPLARAATVRSFSPVRSDSLRQHHLVQVQRVHLRPLQRTPPSAEGELDELLEAFASDDFAAADWGIETMAQEQVTTRVDGMLTAVGELCPTLDEGQRSTMAELLVSPPPRPGKHERRRG